MGTREGGRAKERRRRATPEQGGRRSKGDATARDGVEMGVLVDPW